MTDRWQSAVLDLLRPLGGQVLPAGPLGALTTYRVGGPAAVRVTVRHPGELEVVARAVSATGAPVLVFGRGSNMLVADAGFDGVAVLLDGAGFGSVSIEGTRVTAGAAVALPALARQSVEAGLTGLEWAVGVPGSVGGGVRMNAGGHGSDIAASLVSAGVADLRATGTVERWEPGDLRHSYRRSAVEPWQVVTAATFSLQPGDRRAGLETIREIVRWRREHQPGGQNAGSVFTNPPGDSAGRLIEAVGLKGRRLGTAMVSTKHANFIQADPDGSADDVRRLIALVQAEVGRHGAVNLATEVRLIGFPPEPSSGGSQSGPSRFGGSE